MYPDPITFHEGPVGTGPLLLRWCVDDPVIGILVYRSPRVIAPEETEAFYSKTINIDIRCASIPADSAAVVDPDTRPAYYCIMGRMPSGLFEIQPIFERLEVASVLPQNTVVLKPDVSGVQKLSDSFPELIYATSDPKSRTAANTLAAGLVQRFGSETSSEPKEHS